MGTSIADQVPIAEGLFTWPSNDPRLLGSKCESCGVVTFPAQRSCPACCGEDVTTRELSRRGTIWTFTVQNFLPNRPPYNGPETAETFRPFAVGYVELPDETRVEARFKTDDVSKLHIGMEVELVVEPFTTNEDGQTVVAFFFQPVDEL